MNTISSLTTTTLYVSQSTISIASVSNTSSGGQQQPSTVSAMEEDRQKHHRQHGGGSLMRKVVQTFQSLGLEFPGKKGVSTADDSDEDDGNRADAADLGQLLQGFLEDLRQILKKHGITPQTTDGSGQAGANPADGAQKPLGPGALAPVSASSNVTPAAQAPSQTPVSMAVTNGSSAQGVTGNTTVASTTVANTNSTAPKPLVADVREALHRFLHDLRQALKESAQRRQGSPYDHGDHSAEREIGRNGYGRFVDNLPNLIAALSNRNDANSGKYQDLQESFNRLVDVLGNTANGKKPTLLAFLNKLAGNGSEANPVPTARGSIISATA